MAIKPWLIGAALVVPSAAHAADWFTLLDWACDPKPANEAVVRNLLLQACGARAGNKAACGTVQGTPFACYDPTSNPRKSVNCDNARLSFTVSAETQQTLGWKVAGELTIDATYAFFWDTVNECDTKLKTPVPTGNGGTYTWRSGTLKALSIMEASGTGRITFLGGTVFSEDLTKKCLGKMTLSAYRDETTNACSGPTPTPTPTPSTPTPSPTASSTPGPMPTPTASATPGPTATPPPASPTASPTPAHTPLPTASATPTASPTPGHTPTPTASATPNPTPVHTPPATPIGTF